MNPTQNNDDPKPEILREDKLIDTIQGLGLYQVGINNLEDYTRFVYEVYIDNYVQRYNWEPATGELSHMIEEDQAQFAHSLYFVFKNDAGEMLGGIKITKKVPVLKFAIETEFGYNLKHYFQEAGIPTHDFWHMGRLAISKHRLQAAQSTMSSVQMLKTLMWYTYQAIVTHPHNILVGEADALAYRIYRTLGVAVQRMGEGIDYIGSLTYPVYALATSLQYWMSNHAVED